MYKTGNTGTGNRMRGTRGKGGGLYSGECCQTFRVMSSNIPRNVVKHSGKCRQTFQEISPNIPKNAPKHSKECPQTFQGMSPRIPENVLKHSRECCQTFWGMSPMLDINEENYWTQLHLESWQTSTMELFCKNSQQAWYVDYFRKKASPQIFYWIPNVLPIGCAVNMWCS